MKKIKNALKSVRVKLFMTLSLVILAIILFLIVVNNVVFGRFYLYNKTQALKSVYEVVNNYYKNNEKWWKKYKTFTFFIVVVSKTYLLRRKSYHS